MVIVRPDDDIHKNLLLQTHLSQTIIALNRTSMFQSLGHLPYTTNLFRLLHSIIASRVKVHNALQAAERK